MAATSFRDYEATKFTPLQPAKAARCAPCQLQLCKSRHQPAHSALKEVSRNDTDGELEVTYTCSTCEANLVSSTDMKKPGWRHDR
jgi:hypothetical protein